MPLVYVWRPRRRHWMRFEAIVDKARRDRATHHTVEDSYQFLEMFVRRSGVVEAERFSAEAALNAARARSDAARIAVVAAQTAAETVDKLIAERALSDKKVRTGANSMLWMIWHGPVSIRKIVWRLVARHIKRPSITRNCRVAAHIEDTGALHAAYEYSVIVKRI